MSVLSIATIYLDKEHGIRLESSILSENDPKLHRAGSERVITLRGRYKWAENQHTVHRVHITHLLKPVQSYASFGPWLLLATVSTTVLPSCDRLVSSALFDFLPEAESPGCLPLSTLPSWAKERLSRDNFQLHCFTGATRWPGSRQWDASRCVWSM